MGNALESFGYGVAGEAAGGLMGLALGAINDSRQYNQQARLQGLQIAGQKQMVDYNYQKQMQMWQDTNYSAQMEQMKKAGLNPAMIYGLKGGGGITTGTPSGNVQGATAQQNPGEAVQIGGQIAQMALMQAQARNLDADTNLKNADAANKPLTGQQIQATTGNIQADTQLKGIQDSLLRNELFEKYETQDNRFQMYANEAAKGIEEAKQMMIKTGVDSATAGTQIKLLEATAIGQILRNALTKAETGKVMSDINVNNAEIMKWGTELAQKWTSLSYDQQRTEIQVRLGKFYSAQSQRTYDNILKGISTVASAVKPGTVINQGPKETIIYNQ